jgi:Concanavalin A-like lectin/glucanases superfamily/Secretion system C-terminal sorting domain
MKKIIYTAIAILGLANLTMAQLPSYVPTNSLIGWWPFNGNANDLSGKGNNGTPNGAALTTDRFGANNAAYHFNSSYITLPISSINFDGDFTISIWVNIDTFTMVYPTFIEGENLFITCQFEVNTPSSTVVSFLFQDKGYYDGVKGGAAYANNWMNIVIKNSLRYSLLYINGNLINTQAFPSVIQGTVSGSYLKIGDGRHSMGGAFIGKIDDIGIWNRALTQAEITALYSASFTGISSSLPVVNSLKVYPNPSNGIFSIQNLGEGISNIAVFNLLGEEMYQSSNNNITIGKQTEIDLSTKPKGIYLIQVTTGKSITNKKIILE